MEPTATPNQTGSAPRWPGQWSGPGAQWLGALALLALVLAVYSPVFPGSFVMDDHRLVSTDNPLTNGEFTPGNIWFRTDFTLATFVFWREWLLWGNQPGGYHVVNALLHATSAILLWRLLRAMRIPGAWLAGAILAVHPVAVNSVARIAELKNTLSLALFLGAALAWWRYEITREPVAGADAKSPPWRGWYPLAFVLFLLSLLAKTAGVMLPPLLLLALWWKRGRITWADVGRTLPFWLLSAVMGGMSIWFQKHQALAEAGQTLAPTSLAFRVALAGKVFWFYLGKALFPAHLNLVYPHWHPDPATLTAWIPWLALGAVFLVGGCWRSGPGRSLLFAVGGFGVALFPVLGLFDSQFLVKWQVSDHLEYLPLHFPIALLGGTFSGWSRGWSGGWVRFALGAMLVVTLGALARERAAQFATEETLMRTNLAGNPDAALILNDLGTILAQRADYSGAYQQFHRAVELMPEEASFRQNLGQVCLVLGQPAEAETNFQRGIALKPDEPTLRQQYAQLLLRLGRTRPAIFQYQAAFIFQPHEVPASLRAELGNVYYQAGYYRRAVAELRMAVAAEPTNAMVRNNLAWILATGADAHTRDGAEAVRQATEACRLTHEQSATCLSTLAAAQAETGDFAAALHSVDEALAWQNATGDTRMAAVNQQLRALYQAGQAYHAQGAPDADGD